MNRIAILFTTLLLAGATGCSTVYYNTMEKFGVHKRDIMVDRVKDARDAQQDAKKEFANALEQFKSVVAVKGGNLEAKYNKLSAALQKSEAQATEVRDRIAAVEDVSSALFKEWKAELKQYSNADLRRTSEQKLKEAQARYKDLIAAMKQAESRLEPVLQPLRDQVLFLKHNLNAKAIGGLTEEVTAIQAKVDQLVRDMEASIREADAFIATLGAS
jgi:predicted lipid-binding transport protein (Tim44 family)